MVATYEPLCFTMRESPHRIEISEGEPFSIADDATYESSITYEVTPTDAAEVQMSDIGIEGVDVAAAVRAVISSR